jgi:hypothetical protein
MFLSRSVKPCGEKLETNRVKKIKQNNHFTFFLYSIKAFM